MRADFILFLLENSIALSFLGLTFLTIGIAMVLKIILNTKRHYYEFKVGKNWVQIDE